jgi:4-amino-4-deoxy-L-arabinose transferase-like glycosyltransferase
MKLPKRNTSSIIFFLVFFALLAAVAAFGIYISRRSLSSYDGAMNLQVPVNLIEHGQYATDYPKFTLFDRKIQTGPTVLVPIAVLFLIFGKSFFVANLVNLAYMLGVLVLSFVVVKRVSNKWFGLLVFIFLPLLPNFFGNGLNQLGEIPALFYLLAGVLLLERALAHTKRRYTFLLLAGLALGLAVVTKTVLFIALPSIFVLALLDLLLFKNLKIRHYLFLFACIALPFATFELIKLSQLGLEGYRSLWSQELEKISQNAGVSNDLKLAEDSLLTIFKAHFAILTTFLGANIFLVSSFILLPLVVAFYKFVFAIKKRFITPITYSFLALSGVALSYFGWWLLITPTGKAWPRRIFDGVVLQEVLLIAVTGILILLAYRSKKVKRLICILLAMVGIYVISFQAFSEKPTLSKYFEYPARRETVYRIAETIQNLPPDAVFYGIGWWQAPRLSFLSGRTVTNINHNAPAVGPVHESYFVVDTEMYGIARGDMEKVLSWFENELMDSGEGYFLYRLKKYTGPQ